MCGIHASLHCINIFMEVTHPNDSIIDAAFATVRTATYGRLQRMRFSCMPAAKYTHTHANWQCILKKERLCTWVRCF